MIDTGSTIRAMIGTDIISITLDDRVYPDRTCGQYDAGWWAYRADTDPDVPEDPHYFVSVDGVVWSHPENEVVGSCFEIKPVPEPDWGDE